MKLHSNNIVAKAGIVAIHNLNVFEGKTRSIQEFREALRRSAVLAEKAFSAIDKGGGRPDFPSLVELSVPRFITIGPDHYRLTGGILLWGGFLLLPGAEIVLGSSQVEFLRGSDSIEPATAIPAEMKQMQYDTYNGERLGEISDAVLSELSIKLDKSKLKYSDDDENWIDEPNMAQVKYLSIYAPDLKETTEGRAIAYVEGKNPGKLGFDTSYFDGLLQEWKGGADAKYYDEFLIEFVDKKQPFAYVTVELMGSPAEEGGTQVDLTYGYSVDTNARIFDDANKTEFLTHDRKQIVSTLRAMGGLK
jgi:hypothetical protein